MRAAFLLVTIPPAVVGVYLLVSTVRGLGRLRRLRDVEARLEPWPSVSIVTPACNEERHVASAVRSMLALDYPALQVVAVDDRSTDGTGAMLDALAACDPRLVVEHVEELRPGWLGKVNALDRGVARSSGEWLLVMDADAHLAKGTLRRAIAYAETQGLDLLTVIPTIESGGVVADAVFGLSLAMLSAGGRLTRVADPHSPAVAATGAFILVRRSTFERTPGFEWLRLEVADDFGLCLLIKSHGGKCQIVNGRGEVTLQWYASSSDMARAMQKNLFAILGRFSLPRMALLAVVFVWLALFPLAVLLPVPSALWLVPAAGEAALIAAVVLAGAWTGRVAQGAWLVPVGAAGLAWMIVRAAFVGWRTGGIVWRGVVYRTRDLAAHQRVRV